MSVFHIRGGLPLEGEVTVQGAKNSVLPVLSACLLAHGKVVLSNCPRLTDVDGALDILRHLGCEGEREADRIVIYPARHSCCAIPEEKMRAMRSSIIFLGPMLARWGEAHLTRPGGCELGPRPIDLHLSAVRALGCRVEESGGEIHCFGRPVGGEVRLTIPSVGATENAILCALGARGTTTITNAAREPEIVELQHFLTRLGSRVRGAGSSVITVEGGLPGGGEYTIMGDRIAAATLLSAAAAAGGQIRLRGVDWRHLSTVASVLHQAGCRVTSQPHQLELTRDPQKPLKGVGSIRTAPYPGFPTDAQAAVMGALAASRGCTMFVENIFDNRYGHVPGLRSMGANIVLEGRVALMQGVERLCGARVEGTDLRGGAGLAVAALGAEGDTVLSGVAHMDRGYDGLEDTLTRLGADIRRAAT